MFYFTVRDRARKARVRRADKSNLSNSGDLNSLIDEISSRGNSICSDLSTDQFNINDHSGQNHATPFYNNPYSNANRNAYADSSHQQRVPPSHNQPAMSSASHLFSNDSSSTYPNQPPPPVHNNNDQTHGQAADNSFFSDNTEKPQTSNSNNVLSETTVKDNFYGYQSVEPQNQQQQNYSGANSDISYSDNTQQSAIQRPTDHNPVESQTNLKHDYFEPNRNDKEPQNNSSQQQAQPESNENFYAHYSYSGPDNHSDTSQRPSQIQPAAEAPKTDSQSGGSSGSGSSYAMVSSVKSLESDPRLSPYQFVENAVYPSQSSLNSNESSPLDIQNASTVSATYDKVSLPSMSSFEITGGSSSSTDQIPLYSTSSVVEAIEEASEPIEDLESPADPIAAVNNNLEGANANPVHENRKLFQKAAVLFEEAKRTSLSSSQPNSLENHSTVSI